MGERGFSVFDNEMTRHYWGSVVLWLLLPMECSTQLKFLSYVSKLKRNNVHDRMDGPEFGGKRRKWLGRAIEIL